MEIIKILKAGHLVINQADRQLEIAGGKYILPYSNIGASDWGYVYEKYVGQVLQSEHFERRTPAMGAYCLFGFTLLFVCASQKRQGSLVFTGLFTQGLSPQGHP